MWFLKDKNHIDHFLHSANNEQARTQPQCLVDPLSIMLARICLRHADIRYQLAAADYQRIVEFVQPLQARQTKAESNILMEREN